jgi:hypothetical protein
VRIKVSQDARPSRAIRRLTPDRRSGYQAANPNQQQRCNSHCRLLEGLMKQLYAEVT